MVPRFQKSKKKFLILCGCFPQSGNGRSLVKRHRIVTKLPVGMSVGVCGVFFDVFGCVWVCVGVCGGFSRNHVLGYNLNL